MIEKGLFHGPEVIYSTPLDEKMKKDLSMSVMQALHADQDSTCLCYHDKTAKLEEGLKCLCKAKGFGKMLNAALPEYLVQKAIALGEYPEEYAHEDAKHFLNQYRQELQRMSDDTHSPTIEAKSGRAMPSWERYKFKDAQFLRNAAKGRLDANGKLINRVNFAEHPSANCTSKYMESVDNLVPIETFLDEVRDMMGDMKAKRGVFAPERQAAIKDEVYSYYHKGWASGKIADGRKVHMKSIPHEVDIKNAAATEAFGVDKDVVPPGKPDVSGSTKGQLQLDMEHIAAARRSGNKTQMELAELKLAVHQREHVVMDMQ